MATVYLGHQPSVDRPVAVKVLPPHPGMDDQTRDRFRLEAKTIGGLQNPHILPLYDYGAEDDILYLVMAYIEGGSLEDLLDSGALSLAHTERLLKALARGLDYAHGKGVIHRDIKPGNILLQDGHPLLADFGMVKMVASSADLTGTSIVGTPAYMPPEQGQGLEIDHRADVYALGAVTFEMLTGQPPYEATTPMQMILAHINKPPPDAHSARHSVPPSVAQVLKKAMAKDPDARFQSAGEFAAAFSEAIQNAPADVSVTASDVTDRPAQPTPTVELSETAVQQAVSSQSNPADSQQVTPTQTIIRETTNPLVVLGGFGLIALVLLIVAVLLINNNTGGILPVNPTAIIDQSPAAVSNPTTDSDDSPTPDSLAAISTPATPDEAIFGEVRYSTSAEPGDSVSIRLNDVQSPGDQIYMAWLQKDGEDPLPLGRVVVDAVGEGSLTYTTPDSVMLPALYNELLITLEDAADDEESLPEMPSDSVAYSGRIPAEASAALREIFVTSDKGLNGEGSLLHGARTEAEFAANHAGFAAAATNIGGVRSHAEHTINILRGESVDYNGNERGENPGRDVGVYFFLDEINATLADATTLPDATVDLQVNAELIRVCTENVRQWADEVVMLESEMIAAETFEATRDEADRSTQVMSYILEGRDANDNGQIEPFEGECGLQQIPEYGVQVGNMPVVEGAPVKSVQN